MSVVRYKSRARLAESADVLPLRLQRHLLQRDAVLCDVLPGQKIPETFLFEMTSYGPMLWRWLACSRFFFLSPSLYAVRGTLLLAVEQGSATCFPL